MLMLAFAFFLSKLWTVEEERVNHSSKFSAIATTGLT